MKFIEVGKILINAGLVAWADKDQFGVTLHFTVPVATVPTGVSWPSNVSPPVATGHYYQQFSGPEAEEIWNQLKNI